MNFQQLRSIREAARRNFNLTEVANVLFTSQPGVSRQILEVEEELGIAIFERNGKRLVGLTEPGKGILPIVERLLLEAENLRRAGNDFSAQGRGTLSIATTHTQARYVLPSVVQQFRLAFPDVRIALQQSAPDHIAEWVLSGKADIGIATEGLSQFKDLISFPCYEWNHVVVVPKAHPLSKLERVSLQELAKYPLITYDQGFTGRGHIDAAFKKRELQPDIVLTAMDSDVIQQYVALGLGVGIVASMAVESRPGAAPSQNLETLSASHLFEANTTRLAVRRGAYLRAYTVDFIQRFAPTLSLEKINAALGAETEPS
jgi:LysR family transcriptional regulator, cys regulon transcriptional activator